MIPVRAVEPARVSFDEKDHIYRVDDVTVPSVSQTLQLAGLTPTFWYDAAVSDAAGERGTFVHLATEYLDRGVLDWTALDPILVPFVRAYEAFKADTGFVPRLTEHRGAAVVTFAPRTEVTFGFCLDREGTWFGRDGRGAVRPLILDLKTGASVKSAVGVQLGGYALGLADEVPREHVALQLRPDDRKKGSGKPYRVYEFEDERATFALALGVADWKLRSGFTSTSGLEEPEA